MRVRGFHPCSGLAMRAIVLNLNEMNRTDGKAGARMKNGIRPRIRAAEIMTSNRGPSYVHGGNEAVVLGRSRVSNSRDFHTPSLKRRSPAVVSRRASCGLTICQLASAVSRQDAGHGVGTNHLTWLVEMIEDHAAWIHPDAVVDRGEQLDWVNRVLDGS